MLVLLLEDDSESNMIRYRVILITTKIIYFRFQNTMKPGSESRIREKFGGMRRKVIENRFSERTLS